MTLEEALELVVGGAVGRSGRVGAGPGGGGAYARVARGWPRRGWCGRWLAAGQYEQALAVGDRAGGAGAVAGAALGGVGVGAVPARGVRARRCARSPGPGDCWPTSSGLEPGPELVGAGTGDPGPGRRAGRPGASRRPVGRGRARTGVWLPTTSMTPTGSSGGTGRSPSVLAIVDATGFVADRRGVGVGQVVAGPGRGGPGVATRGTARRGGQPRVTTRTRRSLAWRRGRCWSSISSRSCSCSATTRQARTRFAGRGRRWAASAPVVVTLRADHLAEVAELPELAARVQAGMFLLGAMGEPQLRAAIEGPAAKVGLRLEPGLVDLLVRDVSANPAPCRCCPTPSPKPTSGARDRCSPPPATAPSAACKGRSPGPPTRSSTRFHRPGDASPAICSCGWSPPPTSANPSANGYPAPTSPPTPPPRRCSTPWSPAGW